MKRNIEALADRRFDLLVVGGGIHGAMIAWHAALAGFSVALVERGDFGCSTSANSQKIIHGGLRYLQNLDFPRTRQSILERRRLLRLAPHLVSPMPCMMPIYGGDLKGRAVMGTGLTLYDCLSWDRNIGVARWARIPKGRLIEAPEVLALVPGLDSERLRGGAVWYDGICSNTERLIVGFARTAEMHGAVVANRIEVQGWMANGGRVEGAGFKDLETGAVGEIRCKHVVDCRGPLSGHGLADPQAEPVPGAAKAFAHGINFVVDLPAAEKIAFAVSGRPAGQQRLYFSVPWRNTAMIGTEWFLYRGHPEELVLHEAQCQAFVDHFNIVFPPAELQLKDIRFIYHGLVPADEGGSSAQNVKLLRHFRILSERETGLRGLVSLVGVKYTTAGHVASEVLRELLPGWREVDSVDQEYIGRSLDREGILQHLQARWGANASPSELLDLFSDYGTEAVAIADLAETIGLNDPLALWKAQALFGVREEMARSLSDLYFRRSNRGDLGRPSQTELETMAELIGNELGWDPTRKSQEISAVLDCYPSFIGGTTTGES